MIALHSIKAKIAQIFLQEEFKSRFIANTEWSPSSPDSNPLDYYFENDVKEKKCIVDTKLTLLRVKSRNFEPLRKANKYILLQLKAVVIKERRPINTMFN